MLKILKYQEEPAKIIVSNIVHTVITQMAKGNTETSPEGLLKVLTFGTTEDLQGTLKGPILKFMVYDILIKLYFRSNSLCIAYLFLSFTGKTGIQMF